MTSDAEPGSWQSARYLLAASRLKLQTRRSAASLLPVFVALGNLLLCVLFESPIKEDPAGRSLSLFFFVQGTMIFLLTLAHLAGNEAELLRKTLVMPLKPWARFTFAAMNAAGNPVLQALILSDLFFLLILYHQSAFAVITIPVLILLMTADIVALTSLALLVAIRRSRPPTIVAAYVILGIVMLIAVALFFHTPSAIGILPPMSWTTSGVLATIAGDPGWAIRSAGSSIALLGLAGVAGRRFA